MSLVSEINGQAASIEVLVAPLVVGASTNVAPTLPPIKGSLCMDSVNVASLYVGNGTSWGSVNPTSFVSSEVATLPQLSLSAGGAATLCSWSLQTLGAVSTVMSITNDTAVTIAGSGNTITAPADSVPLIYRPGLLGTKTCQCPVILDGVVQTGSIKFGIDGSLTIYTGFNTTGFGTGPGNNGIMQCSVIFSRI